MKKIIIGVLLTVALSCYVFPFSVNFLPSSLNSKMLLAYFGVIALAFRLLKERTLSVPKYIIISGLLACVFSLWCLFTVTVNNTDQTVYAEYIISFGTWVMGAYGVYVLFRQHYEYLSLRLLTKYLAFVCIGQCTLAIMIDNIPLIQEIVDRVIWQASAWYRRAGRLYGIGCALDVAGVRFSGMLALIAHQIAISTDLRKDRKSLPWWILSFVLITAVGSMISRTTSVGAAISLGYIFLAYFYLKRGGYLTKRQIRFFFVIVTVLVAVVTLGISLYNSSPAVRGYLRFGFEGFFNWAETGEFRTNSTDTLNAVMWVWPQDFRTWMIGSGRIGVFEWGSDIGYCNFILYSGLIGFAIFAIFFIYSHLSMNSKFYNFTLLSWVLIAITFTIWIKVMTDIFFIDALLFCIDGDDILPDEDADQRAADDQPSPRRVRFKPFIAH